MFISQTTDFHFISQTTDSHFANYRFSFRKLQILISQTTDFHFANYRFPFRKLQILISQTTDFHFANYRFPFRKLQISISFRPISFPFFFRKMLMSAFLLRFKANYLEKMHRYSYFSFWIPIAVTNMYFLRIVPIWRKNLRI